MNEAALPDECRRVSPAIQVSVAIQHHPKRAHLIEPLHARLVGLHAEVVTDPVPDDPLPNPLRTYVAALQSTPAGATHRLVIQDDAMPCDGFSDKMLVAIAERPDDLIAFFTPGVAPHRASIMRALGRQESWARLHSMWYPTVALCWPASYAADFAEWATQELGVSPATGEPFRGDDGPVGRWCQTRRLFVWATVPSLVQHPDVEPSLIGRVARAGKNRARVAAAFID